MTARACGRGRARPRPSCSRWPARRSSAASWTSTRADLPVAHDPGEAVAAGRATRRRRSRPVGGVVAAAGARGRRGASRCATCACSRPVAPGARAGQAARARARALPRRRRRAGARWTSCASAGSATAASRATATGSPASSRARRRLAVDRAERGTLGARYKTAHDIVEDLLASRGFREGAAELGDTDAVIDEAREYLTEMASVQNRFARDVWAQVSKLLWGRAYDLEVDTAGARARCASSTARYPLVFLPSHKSNLDGFVMSSVHVRARLPGQPHRRRHQHGLLAARPARPARRRGLDPAQLRRQRRSTSTRCGATSPTSRPSASTSSGTSRAGARAPASCCRRGWACSTTWPTASRRPGSRRSCSCRCRSSTTGCNELARRRRRIARRQEAAGGHALAGRATRAASAATSAACTSRFGEPVPLRASLADGDPNALSKVAFEVCTRINRATPVTPISLATLALLGTEGRAADAGGGAGDDRPGARVRARSAACPDSDVRLDDRRSRATLDDARRARRRRALRRRRRARLPDPRRPRPRGRLLPQRQSSTGSSTARSPSSRWQRRRADMEDALQ